MKLTNRNDGGSKGKRIVRDPSWNAMADWLRNRGFTKAAKKRDKRNDS